MDAVYDKYFNQIYSWAIKKTTNKEDTEDLTNSIFLAIFEYFNKNINVDKLENLIWKIAYNIWSDRAKRYIKENDNISFEEEVISFLNTNVGNIYLGVMNFIWIKKKYKIAIDVVKELLQKKNYIKIY